MLHGDPLGVGGIVEKPEISWVYIRYQNDIIAICVSREMVSQIWDIFAVILVFSRCPFFSLRNFV